MDTYEQFLAQHPEYATTGSLDALRRTEFSRLDEQGHVYLDYTGSGLHAACQVTEHAELLNRRVLGNPHSASLTSLSSTTLVEDTRRAVLDWFNAAGQYTAVFTANATAALKLVGEAYAFGPGGHLLLTFDNHNSVNGVREFARARGAGVTYAPLTFPELRIDRAALSDCLAHPAPGGGRRLFAFPAQSNFSGVQHPLDLVDEAHASGWDVLLDAAALVPTSRLDLARVQADFVAVSFYKMFGYPSGVGCLLIRHAARPSLVRPWFAGGTVNFATVSGRRHILTPGEAGFEDGTLNFHAIPAVHIGLRFLAAAGIDTIRTRVRCLTGWLLSQLLALRHSNGRPLVRVYGPATTLMRGGIVTMNFYDPEGHLLDYRRIEELASARRISLRTGCFCNPGAGETAEHITEADVEAAVASDLDMNLGRFLQFITNRGGRSAGAIRVSFGIASTFEDARAFIEFAATLRDQTRLAIGATSFDIEGCRVIRDGS